MAKNYKKTFIFLTLEVVLSLLLPLTIFFLFPYIGWACLLYYLIYFVIVNLIFLPFTLYFYHLEKKLNQH